MSYSLKSLKVYGSMSSDSLCFSATVYDDTHLVCKVSNDGNGGCNRYKVIDSNLFDKLTDYSNKIKTVKYEKLDSFVNDLLNKAMVIKELSKILKKFAFVYDNKIMTLTHPYSNDSQFLKMFYEKFPGAIILNTLSFEESYEKVKNII